MAPISPDATARYWLDYSVAGQVHSQQMRVIGSAGSAAANAAFDAVWSQMDSQLLECTIIGMRHAAVGSNITNPVAWTGPASYGSGPGDPYQSAYYYDWVGRGVTGRKVRVSFFGTLLSQFGGDYRLVSGESAIVALVLDAFVADPECWVDISGNVPVWHNYADTGVNAYWRNKIR